MTSRRAVNRLYDELSSAEACGAFLFAVAHDDWQTAKEVVSARPSYAIAGQRSELMNWTDGLMALAQEVDRELRVALAAGEVADVLLRSAQLNAEMLAGLVPRMYLSGVAAASGDADSQEHQEKAKEISKAAVDGMQTEVDELREVESARRQFAADLVYGFDSVCQSAGIDPDVVARVLSAVEADVLANLRQTPPSEEAEAWLLCLAEILLDHVGDQDLPKLAETGRISVAARRAMHKQRPVYERSVR